MVELLIVMAIMGILASIIFANFGGASATGRDAKRQADLTTLQNAVEEYKTKYGRYPAQGCGTAGSSFSTESCSQPYITNLAPEFLPRLPTDPNRGTQAGYSYITNADGTVYKLMVSGTVESETVTIDHPLKSCDIISTTASLSNGWCSVASFSGRCTNSSVTFQKSYGAWGGYDLVGSTPPSELGGTALQNAIAPTTNIICR